MAPVPLGPVNTHILNSGQRAQPVAADAGGAATSTAAAAPSAAAPAMIFVRM
ncbi:hypothetical protein GCM10027446_13120 [Angustibacter peucedani]